MTRAPNAAQNSRNAPRRSGIATASKVSCPSPSSARSATKRSRSKFMFAPLSTATSRRSRTPRSNVEADAANAPAAPNGPKPGRQPRRRLPQDLHADRSLTGNDEHIVERMHERQVILGAQLVAMPLRIRVVVARQHDLRAQ